jgi:hypothetical protein
LDRHDFILEKRAGKLRAYIGAAAARQAKQCPGSAVAVPPVPMNYDDFIKMNPF